MTLYLRGKRQVTPRTKQPPMQSQPFISPTAGWISATNLAAAPPASAFVLENFYPTTTGIRMRAGSQLWGTGSETGEPIESAFSYVGTTKAMFVGVDGNIIDLTTPADPEVEPTPDVTGQTSNYYSALNVSTPGGFFLMAANGTDDIQLYDGATWAPIVSGAGVGEINGVPSDEITQLNSYRNRVWLTQVDSQSVWYLPTDSLSGTVGEVSHTGIFQEGGSVAFTSTWSMDAGDGLDDKLVVVSTEGEVAVWQGDPTDTAVWGLVGLYKSSPPMGKNAFLKVGGDLLILTQIGIVPLTAIISKDPAALAMAAVSRNIQPDWQAATLTRAGSPWEIVKWSSRNICYVTTPQISEAQALEAFAVNLETGAWSKITGWDMRCLVLHEDQVYFGDNTGTLIKADITGADQGSIIYYQYVGHMDPLGAMGYYKTVRQARAVFRAQNDFNPKLDVALEYATYSPVYPDPAPNVASGDEWDVGLWDVAVWDAGTAYYTARTMWVSIGKSGFAHAPVLLITSSGTQAPSAELITFEVTYEIGALVV